MESVSSIGKDDDPGFEANFLNKRSRTESFLQKLQKAKSAVANRTLPSIEDLQAVQDGTLALCLTFSIDYDAHVPPKPTFYNNVRTGFYSGSRA
jgi:hypothetical protein